LAEGPVVGIWRNDWLPWSETFVRNQACALERWSPRKVGLHRLREPLVDPDFVTLAPTRLTDLFRKVQVRDIRFHRSGLLRLGRAADYLVGQKAQLVHAHFGIDGVLGMEVARRAGLPLVVTFHGYDVNQAHPEAARSYERLFGTAHTLIAISEFIGRRLEARGAPPEKIVVSPIGIPVVEPHPRRDVGGVCFVGRLIPVKGVGDLIQAMALLPDRFKGTPLRIIGDGPLRAELEARARSLGVNAIFLGYQSSAEVARTLAESRMFCAPSKRSPYGDTEGLGLVILEASAQELPVVGTRHGGIPEAIEEDVTGLLVEEGDVAQLSRAIQRLLEDDGLAEDMGRAGRARVLDRFDIKTRTADLEAIYDRAAGRPQEVIRESPARPSGAAASEPPT
jgi:colanic acid/amylovoran biosynthesis glycosyltransferase